MSGSEWSAEKTQRSLKREAFISMMVSDYYMKEKNEQNNRKNIRKSVDKKLYIL